MQGRDEALDFRQAQGGVKGVGEHLLLMGVGVARIEAHQPAQLLLGIRAQEIANEENAVGLDHTHHFRQDRTRLGDVVDDAVGHDRPEPAGTIRQTLGVAAFQP